MSRKPKPGPPARPPEPPQETPPGRPPGPPPAPVSAAPRPAVTYDDNPGAPELFADEVYGLRLQNGVITLTLTSTHMDHRVTPGPITRRVVARIIMPAVGAKNLAAGLYGFLQKNGLDPVPRPPDQTVQ